MWLDARSSLVFWSATISRSLTASSWSSAGDAGGSVDSGGVGGGPSGLLDTYIWEHPKGWTWVLSSSLTILSP